MSEECTWKKVAFCMACESVVKTLSGIACSYENAFNCGYCQCRGEEE